MRQARRLLKSNLRGKSGRNGWYKTTHAQSRYHDVGMRGQFHPNEYLSYPLTYRPPLQNTRCATGICNELLMTRYLPRRTGSEDIPILAYPCPTDCPSSAHQAWTLSTKRNLYNISGLAFLFLCESMGLKACLRRKT